MRAEAAEATTTTTTTVTTSTEEVRLATTMTGGVSLAIWMGGVTRELNLVLQASRLRRAGAAPSADDHSASAQQSLQLYGQLLELLDVVADIDILSGTSAGGINAVFLALARAQHLDLAEMREMWLDLGGLLELIRSPDDKSVPSLMYGDEWLFRNVAQRLSSLRSVPTVGETPGLVPATTLHVTTTLLTAEPSPFVDSYGTRIEDANHRGVFTFTKGQLADPSTVPALALAARCTSSFPGAFEPSFVPSTSGTPRAGRTPARPAMADYANFAKPHWVADGGILNNQPLGLVIDEVFRRPARRRVRRALLYVVPSAAPAPDTGPVLADDLDKPYGLVDGLLKDIGAATKQSIANDLGEITAHDDRTRTRRFRRLQLVQLALRMPEGSRLLSSELLCSATRQTAQRRAEAIVKALFKAASALPAQADIARTGQSGPASSGQLSRTLPENWARELAPGSRAQQACIDRARHDIEASMPGSDDLPKSDPEFAAFGRGMLEGAKAVVLAVLHAAYAVTDEARRTQLLEGVAETHRAAAVPPVDLAGLAAAVLRSAPSEASLESLTAELVREYQEAAAIRADTWGRLAEIIAGTDLKDLAWIADHDERAGQTCAFDRLAAPAGTVQALVRYLQPAGTDELISQRLFDLVASERALLPVSPLPDQTVELIQFSADTRTLLAPSRTTARSKLTGMQLRNFGAFYKRSWRANDWMWGRLDGAGWIVHVLLDPVRIREQLKKAGVPLGSRASTFLQQLETTFALSRTSAPAGIDPLGELNYLDLPDGVPPLSLPNTALWLASAWQRIIATEEVPALARAIGSAGSDWSPPNSREWASQVLSPGANPVSLLATCPVADETLETDLPSPLMRRTMAKGAATGLAAAALAPQLPKFVRPPLTSAHAIALAVHRMVSAAAGRLAFIIPIGLVLLGVGIVAAGTSSNAWGLGGVAIALSGAYLLTLAAAQSARRTLTALLSVTLVAAIVALLIPFARRWLFGTAKKNGVIASNLYWVGSDWWHPLLVLSVVGALILLAIRGVRRRRL